MATKDNSARDLPHDVVFTIERRVAACAPASLQLVIGDLTAERTDAIVNPSSATLSGGGPVDLAVRRVGGLQLEGACRAALQAVKGGQLTPGQVVLTKGFGLPARYVAHCLPPIYDDDPALARTHLADCYRGALQLARAHELASISFPAIATGIYGFPVQEAAVIAVHAVAEDLRAHQRAANTIEVRMPLLNGFRFKSRVHAALDHETIRVPSCVDMDWEQ